MIAVRDPVGIGVIAGAQLGAQEIIVVRMDDQRAEVWVCDCWTGQLHAPADTFQLCLAHQVRNLQAVIDTQTWASIWAAQLQAIFYNTMRLAHPAHRATLSAAVFQAEWADLERQLDVLLAEALPQGKARTLQRRCNCTGSRCG